MVADYGQLELRLLAHIATCESMIRAFRSGGCAARRAPPWGCLTTCGGGRVGRGAARAAARRRERARRANPRARDARLIVAIMFARARIDGARSGGNDKAERARRRRRSHRSRTSTARSDARRRRSTSRRVRRPLKRAIEFGGRRNRRRHVARWRLGRERRGGRARGRRQAARRGCARASGHGAHPREPARARDRARKAKRRLRPRTAARPRRPAPRGPRRSSSGSRRCSRELETRRTTTRELRFKQIRPNQARHDEIDALARVLSRRRGPNGIAPAARPAINTPSCRAASAAYGVDAREDRLAEPKAAAYARASRARATPTAARHGCRCSDYDEVMLEGGRGRRGRC